MRTVILDDWETYMQKHPELSRLRAFSDVAVYTDKPSFEELVSRLEEADAVIPIRERTQFTKELIVRLPHLKLIAQTGTGVSHLNMEALNRARIPVAITPGGSTSAVTELTFAFILNLFKRLSEQDQAIKNGKWPETIGANLEGKLLGIIGLGKIGKSVAEVAKTFGMKVIAWGPRLTKKRAGEEGVEYADLPDLLEISDVVSLHVRLVPDTVHLLKKEHLQLMKPGAVLINTSRGRIVDEEALIDILKHKGIAGAGLDVFAEEPLPAHHPFRSLDNVVLTPHIGWKTEETFTNFLKGCIDNIDAFFVKGQPQNILNPDVL